MLLAKTLKIVIFPRENAYFQEIEDKNQRTKSQNCNEKLHVFWNFDFKGILHGFWTGFGRPKSRFGGQKPSKMRSETFKNRYKIEVKKKS